MSAANNFDISSRFWSGSNGDIRTVNGNLIVGSGVKSFRTVTGSYSVTPVDNVIYVNQTGSGVVITLMPCSQISGREFTIKKIDTSNVGIQVSGSGVQTIDGTGFYTLTIPYQSITVHSEGTQYFII